MRIVPTLESVVAKSISNVAADGVHPPSARLLRHAVILAALSLLGTGLGACVQTASQTSPSSAAPAAPAPPALPFDQAVLNAANTVFTAAPAGSRRVVIDPLVDGVTGYGSAATDSIQTRITDLVQRQYQRLSVEKFSPESLKGSPLILVGTFTPVNLQNQTTGTREAYRFCLVLGDLETGRIVAKGVARAQLTGVDATPSRVFRDSPVWTTDPATQAYINTCQATKVGDPINKAFLDGLATAALISQGDQAYNAGQYSAALSLYNAAKQQPAGDQLKAYNGLYLANLKLNQEPQATIAFGDAVSYGLRRNRLAVKFLFEPGSIRFYRDPQISGQYPVWMRQIAERAAQQAPQADNCVDISGHTSSTGSPEINQRLSLQRAEYVRDQLVNDAPALRGRLLVNGAASSQMLVGTGKDDISDALDRRVEFKPGAKCS